MRLYLEPRSEFLVARELISQYFDGNKAVQPLVYRLVDDSHTAGADNFQYFIPVIQGCT